MQEKIANLEIKIFYDSAITKKKVRELSKPQHARRVHGTLQMAGHRPGSDAESAAGKPPPTSRCSPRSAGGLQSAPLRSRCSAATFQEGQRTGPAPAPTRPLSTFWKVLPVLQRTGLSPWPGTWTAQCVPITALGAHREVPHFTPLLLGRGPPELGVQGDHIHADVREAAVPPVPTRGLPTAAAREQAEALVRPAGSSHLQTDLGPTLLPARSSLLTLWLPPAEFLVREFRPHPPTASAAPRELTTSSTPQ